MCRHVHSYAVYVFNLPVLPEDGLEQIETLWSFNVLIVKLYIPILCILLVLSCRLFTVEFKCPQNVQVVSKCVLSSVSPLNVLHFVPSCHQRHDALFPASHCGTL